MKIVREHINERFIDDSNPIDDMGIGVFSHKDFQNEQDLAKWVVKAIPAILKMKKIPKDIINIDDGDAISFPWKYYRPIERYAEKYLTIKGTRIIMSFVEYDIWYLLDTMGYPKVDEEFTEGGDPIEDMSIGMVKCPTCGGDGYYADHNPDSIDPYTGNHDCGGCPIQWPCEDCETSGIVTRVRYKELKEKHNTN